MFMCFYIVDIDLFSITTLRNTIIINKFLWNESFR